MTELMLSRHVPLSKFIQSNGHPDLNAENATAWVAGAQIRANARRLTVDVVDAAWDLLGRLQYNSGFRCPALNVAVGGSGSVAGQKPSAHMDGRAIDFVPLDTSMVDAMYKLIHSGIPFEKLIWEKGKWLHLQVARHAESTPRLALMWFGGVDYPVFNATDPRIRRAA